MVNFLLLHQHNQRKNLIPPKMALQGTGHKTQIMELSLIKDGPHTVYIEL